MTEPLHTRIRGTEFGKEGVIIAYTSAGVAVVEWQIGAVSVFAGKYEVVERPITTVTVEGDTIRRTTIAKSPDFRVGFGVADSKDRP